MNIMSVPKFFDVLCLIFFLASPQMTSSQNAEGIVGRLNPRGLEFVREQLTNTISQSVNEFKVDDISGQLFGVGYQISKVNVDSFNLGQTVVTTEEPRIMILGITNTAAAISGSFGASVAFSFFSTRVKGDAAASVSGLNVVQRIEIGRDDRGLLTISSAGCNSSVDQLSFTVNNVMPTFIGRLVQGSLRSASNLLRPAMNEVICNALEELIKKSSGSLFKGIDGKIVLPISNWNIAMDLTLPRLPAVTSNAVEIAAIGRCYPYNFPALTDSFPVPNHPPLTRSPSMFQLSINDYVVNTFLATMEYRELLEVSVYSNTIRRIIGSSSGFAVNTQFLTSLNPAITELSVDNNTPFYITFQSLVSPRINIRRGSFSIIGAYDIDAEFLPSSGTPIIQDLMLDLNFNVTGTLSARNNALSWRITNVDITPRNTSNPNALVFQRFSSNIVASALKVFSDSNVGEFVIPPFGGYLLDIKNLAIKQNAIEVFTDVVAIQDDNMSKNKNDDD